MPTKFVLITITSVSPSLYSTVLRWSDIQKKLMTVSATDISMAMQTSQSSTANWLAATLPATRTDTTSSASAGKKKLIKSAKICCPVGAGDVGRANSEEASMTQRSGCARSLQKTVYVM
jgi:hypothetical protein